MFELVSEAITMTLEPVTVSISGLDDLVLVLGALLLIAGLAVA